MMVMVMASAIAVFIMMMVMLMAVTLLMVVMMLVTVALLMMVMMLVAIALLMMVVMLVTVALLMMMVMLVAIALFMVVMLVTVALFMVVMMVMLQLCKVSLQSIMSVESFQYLHPIKLAPRGGYHNRTFVVLTDELNHSLYLILWHILGVAQDNSSCALYLIVEKFAKVLHIHLALVGIYHSNRSSEAYIFTAYALHSVDNIAEFADARRLYEYAVGVVFIQHLLQSLAEVAHKAAAYTTRIHLGNLYARFFEKTSVDAYLAKFILYKYQLLALVGFADKLLDKSGLARSQKS